MFFFFDIEYLNTIILQTIISIHLKMNRASIQSVVLGTFQYRIISFMRNLNTNFFYSLHKLKSIHSDCRYIYATYSYYHVHNCSHSLVLLQKPFSSSTSYTLAPLSNDNGIALYSLLVYFVRNQKKG